jgi:hypothetical protein
MAGADVVVLVVRVVHGGMREGLELEHSLTRTRKWWDVR